MKSKDQPHGQRLGLLKNGNPPCDLQTLPRCTAKAKSTQQQCRQPAMKNGKCYWHGGESTGPPKNNINALKHGDYTREALAERKLIRQLLKESAELIEQV
jgi:hypothetical protein